MKKHIYYASGLLAMGLLFSCNSSEKGKSDSNSSSIFSKKDDKKEANEIIAFNNLIVKADNNQSSNIKAFTDNFERLDEYIKTRISNPDGFNTIAPIMVTPPSINNMDRIVYPDGFSKEYKPLIDQMNESFEALKALNKDIDVYKSAEDWKEDNGKKMVEFRDKAMQEIKKNRDASNQIFDKLTPVVEKAEETTLDGSPIKNQFLRSKKLLNEVERTNSLAFETQDISQLKTEFQKKYNEIEKLYNENKGDTIPKEYKNRERSFGSFNDSVNDFLGKMRVVLRELEAGINLSESALTTLDNSAQDVLRSYNSFVD